MAKMTSAYANKLLRKLSEDKAFYEKKEQDGYLYVASLDEEPVIPDYDYSKVASYISEIDEKIAKIKHAINFINTTNELDINGEKMSIDVILIKMAQLNKRKNRLDNMRKIEPKTRVNSMVYSARKISPEYQYINYDLDLIKEEYEKIDQKIATMQIELDKFNQTFEFDVEL